MSLRVNQDYVITDSIHVGETEFVLGINSKAPSKFVTWACKKDSEYSQGHYHSDLLTATKDLLARANQELSFCMKKQENARRRRDKSDDLCL